MGLNLGDDWQLWRGMQRARLKNQLMRSALENERVADLYWKQREQRAVLSTRAARKAMANARLADLYWQLRDLQAQRPSLDQRWALRIRSANDPEPDRVIRVPARARPGRLPVISWFD